MYKANENSSVLAKALYNTNKRFRTCAKVMYNTHTNCKALYFPRPAVFPLAYCLYIYKGQGSILGDV